MKKKVFKISFMIHVRVKEHKIIVKLKVKCVMSKKKTGSRNTLRHQGSQNSIFIREDSQEYMQQAVISLPMWCGFYVESFFLLLLLLLALLKALKVSVEG